MPRFDVYKEVSHQIREIFAEHTLLIEPLSLDEASTLDVTENGGTSPRRLRLREQIRAKIWRVETGLTTASAGGSYNKFLKPRSLPQSASPTDYSSSRRRWAQPSSKTCRSASSHGIGPGDKRWDGAARHP